MQCFVLPIFLSLSRLPPPSWPTIEPPALTFPPTITKTPFFQTHITLAQRTQPRPTFSQSILPFLRMREGKRGEKERGKQKLEHFLREAKRKKLKFSEPRAKKIWRDKNFGDDAVAARAAEKKLYSVQSTKRKRRR